uniref:AAA family ATPase n=1 Tax=uncultured Marinobacter sp. TaxID=187379 RepID=UPI0030DB997A
MPKSLFIAPTEIDSGLTSICLGLLRALDRVGVRVGFYKPVSQPGRSGNRTTPGEDFSVSFVRARSDLNPPEPMPLREAQNLLNREKTAEFMQSIVGQFQAVAKDVDVVIVEGLVPDRSEAYTARLNVEMARNLGADVILVCAPGQRTAKELDEWLDFSARLFAAPEDPDVIGVVLNKVGEPERSGFLPANNEPTADQVP